MIRLLFFCGLFGLAACNIGLEDAPFSGDYTFNDIHVEPIEKGSKGETMKARITAEGTGQMKYMDEVTAVLQQDIDLENFTIVHRITITDKDDQTIFFVGKGNIIPKDDQGNYVYNTVETLVRGDKRYETASGKSASQGEILLDKRIVSCIQRGIWSYD